MRSLSRTATLLSVALEGRAMAGLPLAITQDVSVNLPSRIDYRPLAPFEEGSIHRKASPTLSCAGPPLDTA